MKSMRTKLGAFCMLLTIMASAQTTGNVSGNITREGQPAAGATVSLLRMKDTAVVKLSAADKDGTYSFENIAVGKYVVAVTSVGYKRRFSSPFEIINEKLTVSVPTIELIQLPKAMAAATVTTTRPLVEQRLDRTIVNVDASITNIGASALEVLEKSPGVTVDNEGKISLKGKDGVMIMVDGRPTQLSGADLANMLRNMNSSQIDQVEIMTNPPARYDAAGNAGIINIKTKKTTTLGCNGSLTATYMQGKYPKVTEGFNFNYRNGKVNLFTNLSHNYRKIFRDMTIERYILNGSTRTPENYFDQESDKIRSGSSYNGKVGLDYFASKKTTLGFVVNRTSSPWTMNTLSETNISNAAKVLENVTRATVEDQSDWKTFSTNINFRTLLNGKGRELTADVDYLSYGAGNSQLMVNSYFDPAGNEVMKADTLQGYLPQDIKVYSGRIDYVHPISKTSKFEAGVKSSVVRTDNNAMYDSIQYGAIVPDLNRSNHFIYRENINAVYANLSTSLSKKWSAQLGLRLENTNAKGTQMTTAENFDRHYTQLFPTAYFQYKANEKNSFGINYGRRIRRPDYGSLNPFIRFMDRYTYNQGNPNLQPQLSDNIELSHTYKNILTTTLNYTYTSDIIEEVIEQRGPLAYAIPSNVASFSQVGIAISANHQVTKAWSSNLYLNAFHNTYKGVINNDPVKLSTTSLIFMAMEQFKLSKSLTAEMTTRIRTPWLEGVVRAKSIAFVGAGLSQQVMKNKGTIKLTIRDIFFSQKFRGVGKYSNVDYSFEDINDSRVVALGFTYRFNKGKKIAPTKKTGGSASEEQERIGGE